MPVMPGYIHADTPHEKTVQPAGYRYDRCGHPSGPHPMHTPCAWFAPKTQGAI